MYELAIPIVCCINPLNHVNSLVINLVDIIKYINNSSVMVGRYPKYANSEEGS